MKNSNTGTQPEPDLNMWYFDQFKHTLLSLYV